MPPLFDALPKPFADAFDPEAPWKLLDVMDEVLAAQPSERIEISLPPDVYLSGDKIVIEKGAKIGSGTTLQGPAYIGKDVEIRCGAFLRSGVWLGEGALVGASTEVKHGLMLAGSHAPHLNYVGDSVLGRKVNLGAGTILSNFRHDGSNIPIPLENGERLDSGRRKLGAILGDNVLTGCNDVLNPGCIVGRGTQLYPLLMLRSGVYPADSILKLRQEIEVVPRS